MPDPQPPSPLRRGLARVGLVLSALGIFLCGWLAMQTQDWKAMVGFTLLAVAAGAAASTFARRARG